MMPGMDPDFAKDVAWDKQCRYCQGHRINGFSLSYYLNQEPSTEPAAILARMLEPIGDLRYGRLHRCRYCHKPWFENGIGFCTAVLKPDVSVVVRWNDRALPPDAHLRDLALIGAAQGHYFEEAATVPCRALVGSDWRDPCCVLLQNAPPLVAGKRAVVFIDDVEGIEPTEFALPLQLREFSERVPERAMGYAPFNVYWGDQQIGLSGPQDLWGVSGKMGLDLRLEPQGSDWVPSARRPRPLALHPPTIVIADLNDSARAALKSEGA